MFRDEGHPDVSLSDWNTFRGEFSGYLLEEVIDRGDIKLPDWVLPLARGVAIPSPYLLNSAGYRPGLRRPKGWRKRHCDVYYKDIGSDSLVVRGYHGHHLWHVERNGSRGRPHGHPNMSLVHLFGSTPILVRSFEAAMHLAEYSYLNDPPRGLRWVNECPDDIDGAIDYARQRASNEAMAACLPRLAA
jgi:hypothetical protein